MKSFMKTDKFTKSLAGVVAVVATVVVLGAPLTLAEYYAHIGSADHMTAGSLASQAVPTRVRKS